MEVQAALDGESTLAQAEKLKFIRQHREYIVGLKDTLEGLILELASKYQPQIELLLAVPGIKNPLTAIRILAERR